MPYKKSYTYKKRTYKRTMRRYKKKYNRPLRNKVPDGASPVARNYIVRLKYSDTIDFSPVSLATVLYTFRMNSIFDPDQSGTGHQPYGRDQLAALFNRYRVYAFTWIISIAPSNDRLHACVFPQNGPAPPVNFTLACESPKSISKVLSFDGGMPCVFKGKVYLPRLAGVRNVQYRTDDRYSAQQTGNPLEEMNLNLFLYNPSGVTINTSVTFTFIYHTELFDPVTVGQS